MAAAMREVPRHRFVDPRWAGEAYADTPLPIGPEATISAPHMVAIQLELAQLEEGQSVIEMGSGRGYLCALIARLVGARGRVFGVEFEGRLAASARQVLSELGAFRNIDVRAGDAAEGWPEESPFDRILVSYAVELPFPSAWSIQLAEGGRLLAPVRGGQGTYLDRYRVSQGRWVRELRGPACVFVASKSPAPSPKV